MMSARPPAVILIGLLSLGVVACALGPSVVATPTREEIPTLEARRVNVNEGVETGLTRWAAGLTLRAIVGR